MNNKKWTTQEIDTLIANYGNIDCHKLAKLLPGRCINAIPQKALALGLKGNPSVTRRVFSINNHYFHTPNLENSYWAGFIAADGCVQTLRKVRLRVKVSKLDESHLAKLKETLNYGGKIYNITQKNRKYVSLEINGVKEIINDLQNNFKIYPNKTTTLLPPRLSLKNSLAFITGYIDGDGCISIETFKNKNPRIRLQITGTQAMLQWIKKILDTIESSDAKVRKIKNKQAYEYSLASIKAANVIYKLTKVQVPKLHRKWNKIHIMETCNVI